MRPIRKLPSAVVTAALVLVMGGAFNAHAGEVHEVKMLNQGDRGMMVFEPDVLLIEPGDTVRWVLTDPGHSSQSIDGMVPEGAEPWTGEINAEFEYTFEIEGVYGYRCEPHFLMGQVGLIVVGDSLDNLEEARNVELPAPAQERMAELFADLEAAR